jgi:hypothetical protein
MDDQLRTNVCVVAAALTGVSAGGVEGPPEGVSEALTVTAELPLVGEGREGAVGRGEGGFAVLAELRACAFRAQSVQYGCENE